MDPRVYQTSPTDEDEEDEESSAAGKLEVPDILETACFSVLIWPDKKKLKVFLLRQGLSS